MTPRIAIIGSGPTGIYTLNGLIRSKHPLSISIFEVEADPGKGTPYHPDINDQAMLSNIASVELPAIFETLVDWLSRQSDIALMRLNVLRSAINEREFYPRVVLGEYFKSQFDRLIEYGIANGHLIEVRSRHRVADIKLQEDDIRLVVRSGTDEQKIFQFDHVVMATGHNWPENTEIKPGYFVSPWPASVLKTIWPSYVGILGTSLSAIDALITVATAHGSFLHDSTGQLRYQPAPDTEAFKSTLMSRKGLLPEADFYCDYPYAPLQFCTDVAIDLLVEKENTNLLDKVFELFKLELAICDPDYAASIGLSGLTVETLASAYFAARDASDPFVWAASNLAEAKQNKNNRYTVQWRYAILRMHEVIARVVPYLDQTDLERFHKYFKPVFVDDYATVPHQSIERLMALRIAGKLGVLKLGQKYEISTHGVRRGATIHCDEGTFACDAFIDATGQTSMSSEDFPFPSLIAQGVVRPAATREAALVVSDETEELVTRTGGVDLDAEFRPRFEANFSNQLYCAAISFLLHKLPFVQGITSSHSIGEIVSKSLLVEIGTTGVPLDLVEA